MQKWNTFGQKYMLPSRLNDIYRTLVLYIHMPPSWMSSEYAPPMAAIKIDILIKCICDHQDVNWHFDSGHYLINWLGTSWTIMLHGHMIYAYHYQLSQSSLNWINKSVITLSIMHQRALCYWWRPCACPSPMSICEGHSIVAEHA